MRGLGTYIHRKVIKETSEQLGIIKDAETDTHKCHTVILASPHLHLYKVHLLAYQQKTTSQGGRGWPNMARRTRKKLTPSPKSIRGTKNVLENDKNQATRNLL